MVGQDGRRAGQGGQHPVARSEPTPVGGTSERARPTDLSVTGEETTTTRCSSRRSGSRRRRRRAHGPSLFISSGRRVGRVVQAVLLADDRGGRLTHAGPSEPTCRPSTVAPLPRLRLTQAHARGAACAPVREARTESPASQPGASPGAAVDEGREGRKAVPPSVLIGRRRLAGSGDRNARQATCRRRTPPPAARTIGRGSSVRDQAGQEQGSLVLRSSRDGARAVDRPASATCAKLAGSGVSTRTAQSRPISASACVPCPPSFKRARVGVDRWCRGRRDAGGLSVLTPPAQPDPTPPSRPPARARRAALPANLAFRPTRANRQPGREVEDVSRADSMILRVVVGAAARRPKPRS